MRVECTPRLPRATIVFLSMMTTATAIVLAGITIDRAPVRRATASEGASDDYDPTAAAKASIGKTVNYEAVIPPQCYTKTAGVANPCWTCHVDSQFPNVQNDWELQKEYAFSDFALTNRWTNLFVDRRARTAAITDRSVFDYIRQDNYGPLADALKKRNDYPGYRPDLDLDAGFDEAGFARDGSGWRAVRFKPFPGTFWPTNGAANDVVIRLPSEFRADASGKPSRDIYRINLSILEATIATAPGKAMTGVKARMARRRVDRVVEPLDEALAGVDLDGDGEVGGTITRIRLLPEHYVGAAHGAPVRRHIYPAGVEFLHTVRYLDPDVTTLHSRRLKELRYARKVRLLDDWGILHAYEQELDAKERGQLPMFSGSPLVGLLNDFGWQLQGFIEDERGRLRVQTEEETRFCMGCHSTAGVTVDQTFSFARKVPGASGWRHQDLRGIPDVPQAGHAAPEILTYFRRVGGGDGFRANTEILNRFFPKGALTVSEVLRAAPGGDRDITALVYPSRQRAMDLNRAYMVLVQEQSFHRGRDPMLRPPANVHRVIENGATELKKTGRLFLDGRLWLDWDWIPDHARRAVAAPPDERPWTKQQMAEDIRDLASRVERAWAYAEDRKANFGLDLRACGERAITELACVRTRADFLLVLQRFVAAMQDGHASVTIDGVTDGLTRRLPVRLRDTGDGVIIARVHESVEKEVLRVGDRVVSVGGQPIETVLDERISRVSASTTGARRRHAIEWLAFREGKRALVVERGGKERSVNVELLRVFDRFYRDDLPFCEAKWLRPGTAYLRITTFNPVFAKFIKAPTEERGEVLRDAKRTLDTSFARIVDAKNLILDLRGNGGGTDLLGQYVAQYLIPGRFFYFQLQTRWSPELAADPAYRAVYAKRGKKPPTSGWGYLAKLKPKPRSRDVLAAKLVVLIDAGCFSVTDNFCACLKDVHLDVTFVGRPTNGGTGAPRPLVRLNHSGAVVRFCTQFVRSPEGRPIEGRGTKPDRPVAWTRKDVVAGNDPDLAMALSLIADR